MTFIGKLRPDRCELLAVSAPWGVELEEPPLLRFDFILLLVNDEVVEVVGIEGCWFDKWYFWLSLS